MKTYIIFTYVDAVTRVPLTEAPAHSGPANPEGAVFGFALESRYPTNVPTFYGWTEGETDVPGIFSVISKEEYDAAYDQEMLDRVPQPATLGRLQFIVLCQTAGGMTDGMLVAAQKNPDFEAFWIKFQMASAVERDDPITRGALDALAGGGYLPSGKAAVVEAWPKE